MATGLGALGDRDPLDVRRARSVGILADPQRTLDLLTGPDPDRPERPDQAGRPGQQPGQSGRPGGTGRWGRVGAVLFLHLDVDHTGTLAGVGTAERYGALTTELIASWLHDTAQVTVQPVLTVGAPRAAAAGYTPPHSMREEVILQDRSCVFPGCGRTARSCDLDHITGWTAPDRRDRRDRREDRGESDHHGETHPDNLAPLCRRHHRIKTHGRWRYRRNPDHTHTWTSPTGRTYTVDPHGTRHPDP